MILEKYLMPEKVGELVKEQKVQRGSTLYKYFFVVVAMELATGVASWCCEICEEQVT